MDLRNVFGKLDPGLTTMHLGGMKGVPHPYCQIYSKACFDCRIQSGSQHFAS